MIARNFGHAVRAVRTVRTLSAAQLVALVYQRVRPLSPAHAPSSLPSVRSGFRMVPPILKTGRISEDGSFQFLNRAKALRGGTIDWESPEMPLLWRYNLHYFEYALDPALAPARIGAIMDEWIERNRIGVQPAWAPYVVSVRAVNWIKRFDLTPELQTSERLAALYRHGLWLERNLERHLRANHYLKNGQALLLLGTFFEGDDARRWHRLGTRILSREVRAQFLPDGGHIERSPMYHAVALEDLLDAINVVTQLPATAQYAFVELLSTAARRALDFLAGITQPDGEIPLFNDAAFGIGPVPAELFAYGERVLGWRPWLWGRQAYGFPASGFYVMRDGTHMLTVDCGEMGPPYQPGHAHADTLSYELVLDARRVVVDSGVFEYAPTPERLALRGTKAHNTVTVDGADQSEVWGAFRLATRARPFGARVEADGTALRFAGAHDGYRRLGDGIVHRRTIEYAGSAWRFCDEIDGRGTHSVGSRIHLHPDLTARLEERGVSVYDGEGRTVMSVLLEDDASLTVETGWYYPRFGARLPNQCIALTRDGQLPMRLRYVLVPAIQLDDAPVAGFRGEDEPRVRTR